MPTTAAPKNPTPTRGALQVLAALHGPLAMTSQSRETLIEIVGRHARGEAGDIAALEAKLGRPLAQEPQGYQVVDGVAVIGVAGAIMPKANLMTQISGGASAQLLQRDVSAAAADPSVTSILLSIDSPGGSVAGVPELATAIRAAAVQKPVVAYSDGTLASAAYWVASAANAIFVSGPGVIVGSIGVVATHTDKSVADQASGVKRTEITAGKYKRIASDAAPLTAEGAADMQSQVDYYYGLFVEATADYRGTTVETVLEHMADGRIFIGQQAIDAGLVDGIASFDALLRTMVANPAQFAHRRSARAGSSRKTAAPRPGASASMEADAVAYAARHGVRLATARTALGVQAPSAAGQRTKGAIALAVVAHAKERGVSFDAAFKAVTTDAEYDGAPTGQAASHPASPRDSQAAVDVAKVFARKHKVDFVTALKATGGDPGTSAADASVVRYAVEHSCSHVDAIKALHARA